MVAGRWTCGRWMWSADSLADGTELKAVSGIDDSSRFGVSAQLVRRATAGPVCEALLGALRRHGIRIRSSLTMGKFFTGRFGRARSSAEVLFDRVCAENGIRHFVDRAQMPTTSGKWSKIWIMVDVFVRVPLNFVRIHSGVSPSRSVQVRQATCWGYALVTAGMSCYPGVRIQASV
jgi:hypothetical protein